MKKTALLLCLTGILSTIGIKAEAQNERIYDECNDLTVATWHGNNKVISGSSPDWVNRHGDIFRYALDNSAGYSYLVYEMPAGKFVKNILIDFYSPTDLKPTIAVKNSQGNETKYVQGWDNGYPTETTLAPNVTRHYLTASIPADAVQAVVYLDAGSDVEIMRIVVEYGEGYVSPKYNENADFGRIKRLLAKVSDGKDITIGVIGGSMTAGANAEPMSSNCYGARLKNWFENTYGINVTLVNAGIGSTNSYFGAIRAEEHLLKYTPDLVVAEYAANDQAEDIYNHTYEGLLRKLLKAPCRPAVLSVMMCSQAGFSKQSMHLPIAQYYQIPVVSFKDEAEKDIIDGNAGWIDYYGTSTLPGGDGVHPNNNGHQKVADLLSGLIGSVSPDQNIEISSLLPTPKFSNILEDAFFLSEKDITPEKIGTWTDGGTIWDFKTGKGWRSQTINSELIFDITGEVACITYWKRPANEGFGRSEVWVDNNAKTIIDGSNGEHIDQLILSNLGNGKHKLHIKLLDNKPFEVICIAVSGDRDFFNATHNIKSIGNQNEIIFDGESVTTGPLGNAIIINSTEEGYLTLKMNELYLSVDETTGNIIPNTGITDASKFLFVDKGDGFTLRSVLNGKYLSCQSGISASANSVSPNELFSLTDPVFTGIDNPGIPNNVLVYSEKGKIKIDNAFGKKIMIFSVDGITKYNAIGSENNISANMQKGIYLVSIDNKVTKAIVP